MSLDNELKQAMRRVPAPEGFAERVMARIGGRQTMPFVRRQAGLPVLHRAIAATFLLAVVLGGWGTHEVLQARQQALVALRIAGSKVAHAQREVSRHIER